MTIFYKKIIFFSKAKTKFLLNIIENFLLTNLIYISFILYFKSIKILVIKNKNNIAKKI